MSVISISGAKRGKIHHVRGSNNYYRSNKISSTESPAIKPIDEFYNQLIALGHCVPAANRAKAIKKLNNMNYCLSEGTINKVLDAYELTIGQAKSRTERKRLIKQNLSVNLLRFKTHKSVREQILKRESNTKPLMQQKSRGNIRTKRIITSEKEYYNVLISMGRSSMARSNRSKSIQKLRNTNFDLSVTTIEKILDDYQITLKGAQKREIINPLIQEYLLKNLECFGVSSTIQAKIVEYEPALRKKFPNI